MLTEPYPIELFVASEFHASDISAVIMNSNMEPDELKEIIIKCFLEMGLYIVQVGMEEIVHQQILTFLKRDPKIQKMAEIATERMKKRKIKTGKHAA